MAAAHVQVGSVQVGSFFTPPIRFLRTLYAFLGVA